MASEIGIKKIIHNADILQQLGFKKRMFKYFLIWVCTHSPEFIFYVTHEKKPLASVQRSGTVRVFWGISTYSSTNVWIWNGIISFLEFRIWNQGVAKHICHLMESLFLLSSVLNFEIWIFILITFLWFLTEVHCPETVLCHEPKHMHYYFHYFSIIEKKV